MARKRDTILIADDVEMNRSLLRYMFEDAYEIIEAEDGAQAIDAINERHDRLVLIFLDLMMPKRSGLDVLQHMSLHNYMEYIPVIMITGEGTAESDLKAYEYGAADIIYKPFVSKVVKRRADNIIELYNSRIDIEHQLKLKNEQLVESHKKLASSNEFLINALSSVVEFRSSESGEHIRRVKQMTRMFLKVLCIRYPKYTFTKEQIDLIVNASALHDLGKIAIPDSILLKPGKLTPDEFEIMKKHSVYGCDLLERFKQEDSEFYRYCYDICRHHHERFDGKGYPDGLAGDDIPIWAQIVSVVDVYDALVSKRVYKTPYAAGTAIRMIVNGECGTFSPEVLDVLHQLKDVLLELADTNSFADAQTSNAADLDLMNLS